MDPSLVRDGPQGAPKCVNLAYSNAADYCTGKWIRLSGFHFNTYPNTYIHYKCYASNRVVIHQFIVIQSDIISPFHKSLIWSREISDLIFRLCYSYCRACWLDDGYLGHTVYRCVIRAIFYAPGTSFTLRYSFTSIFCKYFAYMINMCTCGAHEIVACFKSIMNILSFTCSKLETELNMKIHENVVKANVTDPCTVKWIPIKLLQLRRPVMRKGFPIYNSIFVAHLSTSCVDEVPVKVPERSMGLVSPVASKLQKHIS